MTNHIQCAQWGTIVLGMRQNCDMKILHYFILYQLMLQDQSRTWNLIKKKKKQKKTVDI